MSTARKADEARPPRGVIGCLTAGFEVLSQNLLLMALPVVLDLVLWLGPRVSVRPLLEGMTDLLSSQQPAGPEMAGQVEQARSLLEQFGEQFNLLSIMGGVPMFQVPSLLARRAPVAGSPLGAPHVLSLSSVLALVPWWGALALAGLMLGFLYLNEIAHQVGQAGVPRVDSAPGRDDRAGLGGHELGDDVHPGDPVALGDGAPLAAGAGKLFRFLLFAFGLIAVGFIVFPLWVLVVALGTSIAQPVGILLWLGGVGLLGYAVLHLLFVIPGLLLGERRLLPAIGESVVLSHVSLSSVLGFVLLALVIYEGLGYAWSLPRSDSWAMLIGIVGNACVATGLTGAAFVFYRERAMARDRLMGTPE